MKDNNVKNIASTATTRPTTAGPRTPAWRRFPARRLAAGMTAAALALTLTACAGTVGRTTDNEPGGPGYEYGASQEEINALVENLDPITIKFQPSATSPRSIMAETGYAFKEEVERRSNGKITVEIVWGQAIASYAEIHDALADGRVDVAYTLPGYQPTEFPEVNALGNALSRLETSPQLGELVANATGIELGWNNQAILDRYEEKGLVPLSPMAASGGYYTSCTAPMTDAAEWRGNQVRTATAAQSKLMTALGATPVSLSFTETFEALQRGTVDCTLGQLISNQEAGVASVANYLGYTTKYSYSRTPGAYLAGISFTKMPLVYQQIIFDSNYTASGPNMGAVIHGNAAFVGDVKDNGGEIAQTADDVQEAIHRFSESVIDEDIETGNSPADIREQVDQAAQKWTEYLTEAGYADGGDFENMDQWFDPETDFSGYAKGNVEHGVVLEHRPR